MTWTWEMDLSTSLDYRWAHRYNCYKPLICFHCFQLACQNFPQMIIFVTYVHLKTKTIFYYFQLESTFAESSVVKRLHLETLRDWQKEKPLDMLLMGKLDLTTINPGKIKPSPKTDETVRQCMEEFREEIFKVFKALFCSHYFLTRHA